MGFKPLKNIKKHYHVKPASFIYPDENVRIRLVNSLSLSSLHIISKSPV